MSNYSVLDLLAVTSLDYINGTQPVAPMTLSFSRVNGGRSVTSQTLLFRLPIELVQEVVAYLDIVDLKSLALVDRDCRQLARSRLFASVVLDYSSERWQLLNELLREVRVRQDNDGVSESPSIGVCIRHLTVRTNPRAMASHFKIGKYSGRSLTPEKKEEVIDSYCETYLPAIAQILRSALPNLDGLEWGDHIAIPQYMFTAISSSPIRQIGLRNGVLGSGCEYPDPPVEPRQRWALRSLNWWIVPELNYGRRDWLRMARFCKSFFEEVAPTLERLSCDGRVFPEDCAIRFPRLRTLWLDAWMMTKDLALENFFPADAGSCVLRSVAINGPGSNGLCRWKFLAKRGHIRGLEVLNLRSIDAGHRIPMTAFLSANPQLKFLLMSSPKPEFLNTTILPFFAANLRFLTSLVITLWSSVIPAHTLDAIGRISSLTSLWIAAGQCYWIQKWIIDNPPSIAALSPLRNLTRLALSEGDSANITPKNRRSEFQLANYRATTGPESQRSWEDWHNERVRKVVEGYVTEVSSLRWVYMGQLVHTVVGGAVVLKSGGMRVRFPGESWGNPF